MLISPASPATCFAAGTQAEFIFLLWLSQFSTPSLLLGFINKIWDGPRWETCSKKKLSEDLEKQLQGCTMLVELRVPVWPLFSILYHVCICLFSFQGPCLALASFWAFRIEYFCWHWLLQNGVRRGKGDDLSGGTGSHHEGFQRLTTAWDPPGSPKAASSCSRTAMGCTLNKSSASQAGGHWLAFQMVAEGSLEWGWLLQFKVAVTGRIIPCSSSKTAWPNKCRWKSSLCSCCQLSIQQNPWTLSLIYKSWLCALSLLVHDCYPALVPLPAASQPGCPHPVKPPSSCCYGRA